MGICTLHNHCGCHCRATIPLGTVVLPTTTRYVCRGLGHLFECHPQAALPTQEGCKLPCHVLQDTVLYRDPHLNTFNGTNHEFQGMARKC